MSDLEPVLSWDAILFGSEREAIAALVSVGAPHVAALSFSVPVDGVGQVGRVFGLVGNLLAQDPPSDETLLRILEPVLRADDNERVYKRLMSGKLEHTPVNKRMVRKLSGELIELGLHLPLGFKPMNFDFATRVSKWCKSANVGFEAFYSQRITATPASLELGRVFSLPVEGVASGTWAETIFDDMLDEDIGLFLEANFIDGR